MNGASLGALIHFGCYPMLAHPGDDIYTPVCQRVIIIMITTMISMIIIITTLLSG